jgi:hypothetical protein
MTDGRRQRPSTLRNATAAVRQSVAATTAALQQLPHGGTRKPHASPSGKFIPILNVQIDVLQSQYDELEAKFLEGRAALEAKYNKLYEPLYTQVMSSYCLSYHLTSYIL